MKELDIKDILENTQDLIKQKKVWYVAIIGRPNVGKSTFINTILNEKRLLVADKPGITRDSIKVRTNINNQEIEVD